MCVALVLLLLGASLATGQEETSPDAGDAVNVFNSPRIVGGDSVTDRSQYAYQVSLRYYGSHFCGGSIVNPKHVLTAAHCCFMNNNLIDASTLSAVVGDLYLTASSSDTVSKSISSIIVHQNYDSNTITNDVALMKLTDTFPDWTSSINLIPLATSSPGSGTDCVVSGWGYTQESGRISEVLQTVTISIIDKGTCVASYNDAIRDGMICAGYTQGAKDACQGDSGGPMVCNSVLAGVVSWGYGCAREGYPGVYTDVAYYRSWIEENIGGELRDSNSDITSPVPFHENNEPGNGVAEVTPLKFLMLIVGLLWNIFYRLF